MTMKKNQTQPKAVQGTAVAKTEETSNVLTIISKAEPTAEELQKENERLKKMLAQGPQTLQEKIAYFQQKEVFIKQHDNLKGKRDYFLGVQDEISAEIEQDEFTSDVFAMAIIRKKQYGSDDTIVKVHNPVLVGDLLGMILGKMNGKLDELQISIEA